MMGAETTDRTRAAARLDVVRAIAPVAGPSEPKQGSLLGMTRIERRWLVRVFEDLLPRGADPRFSLGAADVPMGRFVDDLLGHASLEFAAGLRLCLWIVLLSPLFVLRRLRTFFGLSTHDKMVVLDRLRTSEVYVVREAPILLKTMACLGFCGLPPVQNEIGIHPIDTSAAEWARPDRGVP